MKLNPPKNPNYCATVVELKAINDLAGCDNIKGAPTLGFQAIVDKNTEPGAVGVVFTAECQLSEEFTRNNNLYRHPELNADPEMKGYLEDNRRVRALKLRGHRSDALFLPLSSLAYTGVADQLKPGDTFDELDGHPICCKYEIRRPGPVLLEKNKTKRFSRVDQKFFHLHIDTDNYFRVRDQIPADREIIVTAKYHGTSWRGANTVVRQKLSWVERVAKKVFGVRVQETAYDHIFGSRRVLKDINNPGSGNYYATDIWSEFGKKMGNILPAGFMVFGELVGYTSDGAEIQRGYTYGLPHGQHELYVYRVAQINPQGRLTDLSWDQTVEFCRDLGLKTVPVLWRGKHADFDATEFLDIRFHDAGYTQCLPLGQNRKTVDEGVVVRVEGLVPHLSKAKSPKFFEFETRQLDNDVIDLESLGAAA